MINKLSIKYTSTLLLLLLISACADNVEKASRMPPKKTPLTIVNVQPVNNDTNAEPDGIFIKVNKLIERDTLANTIVVIDTNDNPVDGTISFDEPTTTIRFIPSQGRFNLLGSYSVEVLDGIKDTSGDKLPVIDPWSFTVRDGMWTEPQSMDWVSGVTRIGQMFLDNMGQIILLWFEQNQENSQLREYFNIISYNTISRSWNNSLQKLDANSVFMGLKWLQGFNGRKNERLPLSIYNSKYVTLIGEKENSIRAIQFDLESYRWSSQSIELGTIENNSYGDPQVLTTLKANWNDKGLIHVEWSEVADGKNYFSIKS